MFFVGDIALPSFSMELPNGILQDGVWIGNLEGSLVDNKINSLEGGGVYNDIEAIKNLCKYIPFKAFGIANNHLLDFADVQTSLYNLKELGIPFFGAGNSLEQAKTSVVITDKCGISYRLLAFGWENIQCVKASKKSQGVNPYTRENVIHCVRDALTNKEPVICFMHWNYELEIYPQPYDRQLAHDLIDMGVSAIIGCHAHRVQPIEFYKGRPIVYGLGNFLFYQGHYFEGKLRFPKFCEKEYVFELTDGGNGFVLHHFKYDNQDNRLEFIKSENIQPDTDFERKAIFSDFTTREYEMWFVKNRIQKKILPIFKSKESALSYAAKSTLIKVRGALINLLTKTNLKSANRADRK